MADVIKFTGNTRIDQPPEVVLEMAKSWGMEECLVIGLNNNSELMFGGSISDAGKIMIILEAAKRQIVKTVVEG